MGDAHRSEISPLQGTERRKFTLELVQNIFVLYLNAQLNDIARTGRSFRLRPFTLKRPSLQFASKDAWSSAPFFSMPHFLKIKYFAKWGNGFVVSNWLLIIYVFL